MTALTPFRVAALAIGALLQQQLQHRDVAGLGRPQRAAWCPRPARCRRRDRAWCDRESAARGRVDVGAARQQHRDDVEAGISSSVSRGAGRLDGGIVCASTAAHSAVRPTLSFRFTSMPLSISSPGDVEVAVDQRQHQRALPIGIHGVRVGLAVARAPPTHGAQPSRAASSSAVRPPGGSHLSRGSSCAGAPTRPRRSARRVGARLEQHRHIGGWPCAAAHISAVWPRQLSPASTEAPRA